MRLGAGQALGAQLGCAGRARGAQMGAGTAWACWGAQGGVRVRGARGRMRRVCGARRSRRRQGAGRRRARGRRAAARWGAQDERACRQLGGTAPACWACWARAAGGREQAWRGRARGRQARGARQARWARPAWAWPGRSLCARAGPAGPGWGFVHSDSVFLARFDSVVSRVTK